MISNAVKAATLALLGCTLSVDAIGKPLDGGCPKAMPFDLDLNKLSGKRFKILYGDKSGGHHVGQHCQEIMYTPYDKGKNSTRWQLHKGSKDSMNMLTSDAELKDKFYHYDNRDTVLVFNEADKAAGLSNVGQGFHELDFYNDNLYKDKSPTGYAERILYTDYESVLVISNCYEKEVDHEGVKNTKHTYDFTIAVSDLSKYDDEKEFNEIKDLAFGRYVDFEDRSYLETVLDRRMWFPQICRHVAEGKSIFDLDKLLDTDTVQAIAYKLEHPHTLDDDKKKDEL